MRRRSGWMTAFYAVGLLVCVLGFLTSIVMGFVVLTLGVGVRLLEANLEVQRAVLAEQRALRHALAVLVDRALGGGSA